MSNSKSPILDEILKDSSTHYNRVCLFCGGTWLGLHCQHDGYQNPCPKCNEKPRTVIGVCDCQTVTDFEEVIETILKALLDAKPKSMYISQKYSTNIVDRMAFNAAFDAGADQYETNLKAWGGKL